MTTTEGSERVLAVGIDTAAVAPVAAAHARFGAAYERRVASPAEIAALPRGRGRVERLAALWAAKEAATKTLAPDDTDVWPWPCLDVDLDHPGRPVRLTGRPAALAAERGVTRVLVTAGPAAAGTATAVAIAWGGTTSHHDAEGQP